MQDWQQRRRGGAYDTGGASTNADMNVNVPLGPGEWDEALGLPLCVVCHNVRAHIFRPSEAHYSSPSKLMFWKGNMVGARRISTTSCNFCEPFF